MTREPKSYPLRGAGKALLTVSLFLEPWLAQEEQYRAKDLHPVFSLTGRDGYIDARQTFLDTRDPTGVAWAEMWLEGVNHLNRLLQAEWFKPHFETWQSETEQLVQSEALQKIREISLSSAPAAFQAAKFLAGQDWKKKARGRPSAAEVKGELGRLARQAREHDDDLARITNKPDLKVVG